jgi:chromosomal replication initiation ATPase DnaA
MWTENDEVLLRDLYPAASWKEMEEAMPFRTRTAIKTHAQRLGIRRVNRSAHGCLPKALVIIAEVCCLRAVPIPEVFGFSRERRVTAARWESWWRIKYELGLSYPQIAHIFGRDHTTVLHAIKRMRAGYKAWDVEPRRAQYREAA